MLQWSNFFGLLVEGCFFCFVFFKSSILISSDVLIYSRYEDWKLHGETNGSLSFPVMLLSGEAAIQKIPQSSFQANAGWAPLIRTGCLFRSFSIWRCRPGDRGRCLQHPSPLLSWWRPSGRVCPHSGGEPRRLHSCSHLAPCGGLKLRSTCRGENAASVFTLSEHGHQPLHSHSEWVWVWAGPLRCSLCFYQQEGPPGEPRRWWIAQKKIKG